MSPFLIKNITDLNLITPYRFIDCSYYLPHEDNLSFSDSPKISNDDIFFCVDSVADTQSPFSHTFPPQEVFFQYCQEKRLNYDTHYIFYDHKGIFSAPRVYLTFLAYGFDKISVLDGGYPAFKNNQIPSSIMPKDTEYPLTSLKNPISLFVNHHIVTQAIDDKSYKIIDARPKGRFHGLDPEPRAGLESGHIPNSVNLPFMDLLTIDKKFKSISEIQAIFDNLGINENHRLIFTCGSGITACVIAFGALMCGFKLDNIKIYDASWCEWGNGHFKVVR